MCAKTERVLQRCVSGIITRVSYSSNICILHNSSHVSYIALLRWKLSWMLCRKWCTLFSFSWLMPCVACLAWLPVLAQAGQWRRWSGGGGDGGGGGDDDDITNEMKNYEHFLFTAIVIACLLLVMPSSWNYYLYSSYIETNLKDCKWIDSEKN